MNLIDYSLTPSTEDGLVAAEAFAGSLSNLVEALGADTRFDALDSLTRVIASVRHSAFKQAIKLAMAECDKYIERRQRASAETNDIQVHFTNRDMIKAAGSCKGWIETIKVPS